MLCGWRIHAGLDVEEWHALGTGQAARLLGTPTKRGIQLFEGKDPVICTPLPRQSFLRYKAGAGEGGLTCRMGSAGRSAGPHMVQSEGAGSPWCCLSDLRGGLEHIDLGRGLFS